MGSKISLDDLLAVMVERYDTLSNRLQLAARYALEHPNEVALETVTELASRAAVQPSVLVRLSKAFGFSGFTEFQKVFQSALAERAPSYGERIRRLGVASNGTDGAGRGGGLLHRFCEINQSSLQHLSESLDEAALGKAVDLIVRANQVNVIGQRRSHTIAVYLAYAFTRAGKRSRLLTGAGGTLPDEMKTMAADDVLIAISMHPYSPETRTTADWAAEHGIPVIAITDGELSPLSRSARVMLEVRDADFLSFRSLVAQTCLAQILVIAVAAVQGRTENEPPYVAADPAHSDRHGT